MNDGKNVELMNFCKVEFATVSVVDVPSLPISFKKLFLRDYFFFLSRSSGCGLLCNECCGLGCRASFPFT